MNNTFNYYPSSQYNRMSYDEFFDTLGYNNMNIDNMNNNMQKNMGNNNLFNSYDAYVNGNLFEDQYIGYKNYKPINLNPKNKQQELLYNLNQKHFGMHEANLALDVNPNNNEMMEVYKKYRDEFIDLLGKYQKEYGPLCVSDPNLNNVQFGWEKTIFPWERGDK